MNLKQTYEGIKAQLKANARTLWLDESKPSRCWYGRRASWYLIAHMYAMDGRHSSTFFKRHLNRIRAIFLLNSLGAKHGVKFLHIVAMAKRYLHAKNERNPSNRLAKIYAFAKTGALGAFKAHNFPVLEGDLVWWVCLFCQGHVWAKSSGLVNLRIKLPTEFIISWPITTLWGGGFSKVQGQEPAKNELYRFASHEKYTRVTDAGTHGHQHAGISRSFGFA